MVVGTAVLLGATAAAAAAGGGVSLLQTAVTSLVGTLAGLFLKDWWDDLPQTDTLDRVRATIIRRATTENDSLIDVKHEVVEREELKDALLHLLRNAPSGVCVLVAPPGSGKSAYLNVAMDHYREQYPDEKIYFTQGLNADYFTSLGVPLNGLLKDLLPKKSIFIFDQIDIVHSLTDSQKNFIVQMATSSRNSNGHFRVFLVLSSAVVAQEVLGLNGGEKIFLGMNPGLFKWNEENLLKFAHSVNKNESGGSIPDEELGTLVKLYAPSECCGPLFITIQNILEGRGFPVPSESDMDVAAEMNYSKKLWKDCQQTFKSAFIN